MDLHAYHTLALQGLHIFRATGDPLTAHAAQLLFQATSVPLTAPQQNAAIVLGKQVRAYNALYPHPVGADGPGQSSSH
jgi:hypothetical protein